SAALLVSATALAPLLLRPTAPVKLFAALVNVMALAPALMVVAPAPAAWVNAPVWVIAAPAVTARVPVPTLEVPSDSACAPLVSATLLAPLLLRLTEPLNRLAWLSVMALAPALKVAAPAPAVWVNTPVWVIAPPV